MAEPPKPPDHPPDQPEDEETRDTARPDKHANETTKPRDSSWSECVRNVTVAVAALGGLGWAISEVFVLGDIQKAELELVEARRIPSLDFDFAYKPLTLDCGTSCVVVTVSIKNTGSTGVTLDLGKLAGVEESGEEFSELVIQRHGTDEPDHNLDYIRLDGNTDIWTRVLVDVGSTKRIPFLVEDPEPGVNLVQFRARLSSRAKRLLIENTEATFDEDDDIFWTASDYVDLHGLGGDTRDDGSTVNSIAADGTD